MKTSRDVWYYVKGMVIGYLACDEDEIASDYPPQFEVLVVRDGDRSGQLFLRPIALDVRRTDGSDDVINCGVEVEFSTCKREQWEASNECERAAGYEK